MKHERSRPEAAPQTNISAPDFTKRRRHFGLTQPAT
jgi:hypothetical protein